MLLLIAAVALGVATGYFATENTTPVTIRVADYVFEEVPLYLVILGSVLVGLLIAWILYVARTVSSRVTIYGKDQAVKRARQTAVDFERRIHELEAENARLRTEQPIRLNSTNVLHPDMSSTETLQARPKH